MKDKHILGLSLLLVTLLVAASGCAGDSQAQSQQAPAQTAPPGATPANQTDAEPEPDEPEEDAIAIEVGTVELASMSSLYSTSATLRADKQATVTARTKGVIRELLVEEGDWVKKGQPLAILGRRRAEAVLRPGQDHLRQQAPRLRTGQRAA